MVPMDNEHEHLFIKESFIVTLMLILTALLGEESVPWIGSGIGI